MRARNLRVGLVIDVKGERGFTDKLDSELIVWFFSNLKREYEQIKDIKLRDIKLVLRSYVKNPVLFPKE